jgi:diketogulonate reductase-like aldo/keto reductase
MERARELGYARSIGVSNFAVTDLQQVLATATVPSVVNQVQFSPCEYNKALLEACWQKDLAQVDALDRTGGTDCALEHKWWRG